MILRLCAFLLGFFPAALAAQDVTLKLHHPLPAQSNLQRLVFEPWVERIEAASDGRIEIVLYPSMQLGGIPPELMDQAIDGVADIVATPLGYTPGRYPNAEVFELPFLISDVEATTYALWQLYDQDIRDEFPGVEFLAAWVHGPGVLHTQDPVETLDDMEGMKIRGGTRLITQLIDRLGAEAVGIPFTQTAEALSRGVIDGTTSAWDVTGSLKITEMVSYHTEFEGAALFTAPIALAINSETYSALPDDLRAIIDAESGLAFSVAVGRMHVEEDAVAREVAIEAGNDVRVISATDTAIWRARVEPIYAEWIAQSADKGVEGAALIDRVQHLMDEFIETRDTPAVK